MRVREIESKFDVPLSIKPEDLVEALRETLGELGFSVDSCREFSRKFVYYDTENFLFHCTGTTVRKVSGFDPKESPDLFRYDYKSGPLENRFEESRWSGEDRTPSEVIDFWGIRKQYCFLHESAKADALYHEIRASREGTKLVITLDRFFPEGGPAFVEFEAELEQGDESMIWEVSNPVRDKFSLTPLSSQKYSRIMSSKKER